MARKHSKTGVRKVPVTRTSVVTSAGKTERKVSQNPTTGEFEVVTITTPAVITNTQGKALGSTRARGEQNKPESMAPRGRSGSAPAQQKKRSK